MRGATSPRAAIESARKSSRVSGFFGNVLSRSTFRTNGNKGLDGTLGNCSTATACYVYNANGQRVRKTVSGSSVDFVYDLAGDEIAEMSSSGAWDRGEIWVGGPHLATYNISANTTYFSHTDWLGTERTRTDMTGQSFERCSNLPFGDGFSCSGSDISPFHFTGYERDAETNLNNAQARFDSPLTGRFLSADPSGLSFADRTNPQTLNLYAYVRNSPLMMIDPFGLTTCDANGDNCFDSVTVNGSAPDNGLIDIPQPSDPSWCNPYVLIGCGWPAGSPGPQEFGGCVYVLANPCGAGGGSSPGVGGSPTVSGNQPQTPTPAQAATNYCQQHGQLSFNIPFTHIPVTIGFSATLFGNYGTTNDIALTFPPSAGASLDITVGAPQGFNVPVQVGSGKNLSVGTFLTPSGPSGFSLSLGPSVGSPVTFSPQVANACGLKAGGG